MQNISSLLTERSVTHGDFKDNATIASQIRKTLYTSVGFHALPDVEREAIHQIISKISRLVSSAQERQDTWTDIAGYAMLVLLCKDEENPTP